MENCQNYKIFDMNTENYDYVVRIVFNAKGAAEERDLSDSVRRGKVYDSVRDNKLSNIRSFSIGKHYNKSASSIENVNLKTELFTTLEEIPESDISNIELANIQGKRKSDNPTLELKSCFALGISEENSENSSTKKQVEKLTDYLNKYFLLENRLGIKGKLEVNKKDGLILQINNCKLNANLFFDGNLWNILAPYSLKNEGYNTRFKKNKRDLMAKYILLNKNEFKTVFYYNLDVRTELKDKLYDTKKKYADQKEKHYRRSKSRSGRKSSKQKEKRKSKSKNRFKQRRRGWN